MNTTRKRQKLADDNDNLQDRQASTESHSSVADRDFDLDEPSAGGRELSDSDNYAEMTRKSRHTSKRKIRATGASKFGETLQSLLETDVPSALPLSLKPSIARKHNDEKLEIKAKKVLQVEKREQEDKGRTRDVIGGWGAEGERALRKVAQRGVVKLFNAIQQSQTSSVVAAQEAKEARGSGKPTLPAPTIDDHKSRKKRAKDRDNVIGRGKESIVNRDDFFQMIKSGGVVSKV